MTEMFRVEGIRKHYDGVQALRGADFSVAAGEVHALMGENGAGKSTLAKIAAGSVREEEAALGPVFRSPALKAASSDVRVSTLSGGNQQKVLLARCLLANPEVLFLDDPTRGIDVGAKQEIYALIEKLAAEGKGVILVSSELPELLRCSDRILVMREGLATAMFDAREASEERILKAATL